MGYFGATEKEAVKGKLTEQLKNASEYEQNFFMKM